MSLPGFLARAQARSLRLERLFVAVARTRRPSPEQLHDLHRELRRARVDLRVLGRTLPKAERRPLRDLDRTLRTLTSLAGEARDRDVLELELARHARGAPPDVAKEARSMGRELHREGRAFRKELQREVRGALVSASTRLPLAVLSPRGKAERALRFRRAVARETARAERELSRAHVRVVRRASVDSLHELRIALRRLRHLRTSLASHPATADLPPPWRRFQSDLGVHHDVGVLVDRLRSLPPSRPRRRLRRRLRAELDRRQERAMRVVAEHPPTVKAR